MKAMRLMLAVVAAFGLGVAAPVYAQDAEKPAKEAGKEEGKKEEGKKDGEAEDESEIGQLKKQFKDVDKVIAGVTLTQADLDSYEKHEEAFENYMEGDEKFEELADKSIKEAFDYAVKSEKYLAWAKERELNGEEWLRKAVRILVFEIRSDLMDMDDMVESMKEWKETLKEMKDTMSEEEYKEAVKETDEAIKSFEEMRDFAKSLPAPTEAEAKLLKENDDEEDDDDAEEESMD